MPRRLPAARCGRLRAQGGRRDARGLRGHVEVAGAQGTIEDAQVSGGTVVMTTCELTRERLQEQMDGTLDPVIARDVDRHLAICAGCRGFAADLTAIVDAAASIAPID